METTFVSSTRLWIYAGDPDSSVHNSDMIYAQLGEYFFNSITKTLWLCYQGDISQLWSQIAYTSQIPVASPARSQSSASRSLNTIFQVSSTRWSVVRYSVDISTTVSLSGSQVGQVILEMATNAAFTTGVQTLQEFSNGNSGTLVIGLILTQLNTACLSGDVPPGNYVRLRTVNTTGTPTFTYQAGQEVLV